MKYDSNQIALELGALHQNKDLAFQQYHKLCGAIDLLTAMQKNVLEAEKEEQLKLAAEEQERQEAAGELEPVPDSAAA